MDRSSAHHQLHSPHGCQLHQIDHLQVRSATQHHHGQRHKLHSRRIPELLRRTGHQNQLCISRAPTVQQPSGESKWPCMRGIKKRLLAPLKQAAGNWVEELPSVLWSLRTTPNTSTQYTPFFMVYMAEAVLPHDLRFGAPQITGYEEEEADEALANDKDAIDEARDTTLARSEGYQDKLQAYQSSRFC